MSSRIVGCRILAEMYVVLLFVANLNDESAGGK
jgi:hypothetical protein